MSTESVTMLLHVLIPMLIAEECLLVVGETRSDNDAAVHTRRWLYGTLGQFSSLRTTQVDMQVTLTELLSDGMRSVLAATTNCETPQQ